MSVAAKSEKSYRAAWLYYAKCYKRGNGSLAVMILLSLVQFVFILPTIYLLKKVFDVIIPRGDLRGVFWYGIAIGLCQLFYTLFALWVRSLTLKTTKVVVGNIRYDLISRLYALSRSFYTDSERGNLHTTIVQDTERVDMMSNGLVSRLLPSLLAALSLSAVMIWISWRLFIAVVVIIPLLFLVDRLLVKKLKIASKDFRHSFEKFSKGVLFVTEAIDLTRAQTAEKHELRRQWQHVEEVRETSGRFAWFDSAYSQVQSNLATLASVIVLMAGGVAVANKSMTMGDLLSFFVTLRMLNQYGAQIIQVTPLIVMGNESLQALYALLSSEAAEPYQGTAKIDFAGEVRLENVFFRYGEPPVLNGVNLTIRPRRAVAILGANGCGKSTILHLILGFYRPQGGALYCDGQTYDGVDLACVRRAIGLVPQNPRLFSGSIRENIAYGLPEASLKEIRYAASLALADEFITNLPQGYETNIGDDGARLSGGQRQRIAIARALLRKPKLLILDEPTNHLDIHSVARLMENLRTAQHQLALLLVSHDNDVIRHADEVYEIENGFAVQLTKIDDAIVPGSLAV